MSQTDRTQVSNQYSPPAGMTRSAHIAGRAAYDALATEAETDYEGYWIGPIAKPKDIRFADNLHKTRSGKIMRRLLRSVAKGEAITQDVSTLENPAILNQLSEAH